MRYAIISDVHSNYNALLRVLLDIEQFNIDRIISLGDNIGYGLFPDAVLAELRKRNIISIQGNHEKALFDRAEYEAMSYLAKKALNENRAFLNTDMLAKLKKLPTFLIENDIRFVHGAPPNLPSLYINRLTDAEILSLLKQYPERIAFCGHTHESAIYEISDKQIQRIKPVFGKDYKFKVDKKYIVNVGSVSFQRIGKRVSIEYVIFDQTKNVICFFQN